MKLTMKTLILVMMGPVVVIILYMVIFQPTVERWGDLPLLVKLLAIPPLAGLAYMVVLGVKGLFKKRK